MERTGGCHHCGEQGSVESGPCGGMFAMNHCHACGRDFYGSDERMPSDSPYAKGQSYYNSNRLADGTWTDI